MAIEDVQPRPVDAWERANAIRQAFAAVRATARRAVTLVAETYADADTAKAVDAVLGADADDLRAKVEKLAVALADITGEAKIDVALPAVALKVG